MTRTHVPRARRRLPAVWSLASLAFVAFVLIACGDSSSGPLLGNPVGRYELVGCSYGDTSPASIENGCGTGGTNHHEWSSGSVVLDENGTISRTLVVTNEAWGDSLMWSSTDTVVSTGTWTLQSGAITAMWSAPSTGSMVFTPSGSDLIRENSEWNEWLYFWYRRTP